MRLCLQALYSAPTWLPPATPYHSSPHAAAPCNWADLRASMDSKRGLLRVVLSLAGAGQPDPLLPGEGEVAATTAQATASADAGAFSTSASHLPTANGTHLQMAAAVEEEEEKFMDANEVQEEALGEQEASREQQLLRPPEAPKEPTGAAKESLAAAPAPATPPPSEPAEAAAASEGVGEGGDAATEAAAAATKKRKKKKKKKGAATAPTDAGAAEGEAEEEEAGVEEEAMECEAGAAVQAGPEHAATPSKQQQQQEVQALEAEAEAVAGAAEQEQSEPAAEQVRQPVVAGRTELGRAPEQPRSPYSGPHVHEVLAKAATASCGCWVPQHLETPPPLPPRTRPLPLLLPPRFFQCKVCGCVLLRPAQPNHAPFLPVLFCAGQGRGQVAAEAGQHLGSGGH